MPQIVIKEEATKNVSLLVSINSIAAAAKKQVIAIDTRRKVMGVSQSSVANTSAIV